MKAVLRTLIMCLCVAGLAACGSAKHATSEEITAKKESKKEGKKEKKSKKVSKKELAAAEALDISYLLKEVEAQSMDAEYLTAKIRFNLRHNNQNMSVGGTLRMKKDDVIQMSLVAFGFVEAARIELTKDEVLVIDRINKRYVRAPYSKLSFLREAELDFWGVQSMFRSSLFVPGRKTVSGNENFLVGQKANEETTVFSYQNKKLKFNFMVKAASALLQQVQIASAKGHENEVFHWNYNTFMDFQGYKYPVRHKIVLAGEKGFEADLVLSNLSNNSKWETRTSVKGSYTQLDAETMLIRLLQLN